MKNTFQLPTLKISFFERLRKLAEEQKLKQQNTTQTTTQKN